MNEYPNFELTGGVALVTGAARGLGRAISLALARAGADIALGLRDVKTGGELAGQIEAMGRRVLPLQMDMSCVDQIFRAVDDAAAHFGKLDILVNNAGIAPENLAENVREEDFDRTLAINLKGTFFASQAAGRVMIRRKYGRIINMSSQAGFAALPTESIYCMTKAGIAHLTKCLAVEWGKYNILVNAVACTQLHLFNRKDVKNFGLVCIKTILEFSQMIHQKLPLNASPFMQLPYFTEDKLKILLKIAGNKKLFAPTCFLDFIKLSKEERKPALLSGEFDEAQIDEIEKAISYIPIYENKVEIFVEGFDEIVIDDFVTEKITVERKNIEENKVKKFYLFFRKLAFHTRHFSQKFSKKKLL